MTCRVCHDLYAVVTLSTHSCFLLSDCSSLLAEGMWKKCESVGLTLCWSVWYMGTMWSYTSCVFFASWSSLVFLKRNSFQPIHWSIPYCHIPCTRLEDHILWVVRLPWCRYSWQHSVFGFSQCTLRWPLIAWSHPMGCCSWNAVSTRSLKLSAGPGLEQCHWDRLPVDQCAMP